MLCLVECLGYSAFILEFYIAIDVFLICLSKLVNETITSKAYQYNIKSDIKLQYESRVNILKR